ncbi:glycogen synthase GlgA [Bacillus spizizenii]|uniref:Glycogen synthase n=2 Tax=Bacillus spizizenii TaxID=96241 RepID=A0A9Q4H9L3_BACSC|nr:glycogen synthase GlgA [Bacillus spizizenii]KFI02141.1 glycogen synthase [Bacillus sp. BSC154]QCJ18148.1 glycogen synthase GlgA [Bacillus subtilis]ADM39042.1 glycogen synthase [Bacillus spizizenii str. W23]AJW84562.1 glycogen synthase [Bacillus spizizenii]EFG93639.1 glycogen synthase [Bacillus spizizenii ATCC 6633 = JCM 2499]
MKVLFAVSECIPFVKSGGLADVAGALPKALARLGNEVAVMLPKYSQIPERWKKRMEKTAECTVAVGWRQQYCGIEHMAEGDVNYYFIDNEYYFNRDSLYGHYDDGERFAFFSRAVLEAAEAVNIQADIVHTHDWHTAMVNYLLKEEYRKHPFYEQMRSILTIHNLQFQGIFPPDVTHDLLGLEMDHFHYERLEYNGFVNFMKAGIIAADHVTTVSPTYRNEILTPYYGEQLEQVLRYRENDVTGILNGIDDTFYQPKSDPYIETHYDSEHLACKEENKTKLQRRMGLPERSDIPLISMVTRLTKQKGLDLVRRIMHELLEEQDIQLVVLGTGEREFEDYFRYAEFAFHEKCRAYIGFDEPLAHQIYAGSDMFLMPSKFEPCGLGQLIALQYGSIPIVRETGGLYDTVRSYQEEEGTGNGFTFSAFNAHDLKFTIERALSFYRQKDVWKSIMKTAMNADYSWEQSAKEYQRIFEHVTRSGRDVLE